MSIVSANRIFLALVSAVILGLSPHVTIGCATTCSVPPIDSVVNAPDAQPFEHL